MKKYPNAFRLLAVRDQALYRLLMEVPSCFPSLNPVAGTEQKYFRLLVRLHRSARPDSSPPRRGRVYVDDYFSRGQLLSGRLSRRLDEIIPYLQKRQHPPRRRELLPPSNPPISHTTRLPPGLAILD